MLDYSSIVKRSFEVIKKNKWLFVYGLALASLGSGGGRSFNANLPSDSSLENIFKDDTNLPEKASYVLGAYTNQLLDWLKSVPISSWAFLSLVILLVIFIAVIVRLILSNWAKGALIYGSQLALDDKEVNLPNTSPVGISSIKNLIIFSVIMTLIILGLFIVLPTFWFVGYFLVQNVQVLKVIWTIIGTVFGAITFFVVIILFSMVSIYAERLIVLKNYLPWPAWKKALSISKGNFLPTLVMGIVNMIVGTAVGCASVLVLLIFLGIPAAIIIYQSVSQKHLPSIAGTIALVISFLLFIAASLIVKASIVIFKYTNWNQVFNEVIDEIEGDKMTGSKKELSS